MKNKKGKIIAMIPAKKSSQRLPAKNLALLDGKPLIYYAIKAAKESGIFDAIMLNSDDPQFKLLADRYGIGFYLRPEKLGSSTTKTDEVVYDFMNNNPGDITAWVSPIAPLQSGAEVRNVIEYFCKENLDSLITVKEEQVHCLLGNKPINYNEKEIFAQTQDLTPIYRQVYSVMMWRNKTFLAAMKNRGYAVLCGKVGYYPISKLSSLIVKTDDDLRLIEYVLTGLKQKGEYKIQHEKLNEC